MKQSLAALLLRTSLALVLAGAAFAQKPEPQTKPLLISQYMRNAGLTYLDDVDKMFTQAADDHIALMRGKELPDNPGGMPSQNVYGKALTDLEGHMEINITSNGDKKFLKLLTLTRSLAGITFLDTLRTSDPAGYGNMPYNAELSKLYPDCLGQAHIIIKSGIFSAGPCSDAKFNAAVKLDKAKASATRN